MALSTPFKSRKVTCAVLLPDTSLESTVMRKATIRTCKKQPAWGYHDSSHRHTYSLWRCIEATSPECENKEWMASNVAFGETLVTLIVVCRNHGLFETLSHEPKTLSIMRQNWQRGILQPWKQAKMPLSCVKTRLINVSSAERLIYDGVSSRLAESGCPILSAGSITLKSTHSILIPCMQTHSKHTEYTE